MEKSSMKLLVINGPNLNMLGIREPELYGKGTYQDLVNYISNVCKRESIDVSFFQSNHEGELIDVIQKAYGTADAIVINPAGYTHTSVALLDALLTVQLPAVEVHLTSIPNREEFRKISYVSKACLAQIEGKGFAGYEEAVLLLKNIVVNRE